LMHIYFYIYVHEVKHERTEQNVQYLIGQSIMTSNEWCISLGTTAVDDLASRSDECDMEELLA
jgi:hypothetical protein